MGYQMVIVAMAMAFTVSACKGGDEKKSAGGTAKAEASEGAKATTAPPSADKPDKPDEAFCASLLNEQQVTELLGTAVPLEDNSSLVAGHRSCTWSPESDTEAQSTMIILQVDCRNPPRYMNTSRQLLQRKPGYADADIGDDGIVAGEGTSSNFIFMTGECGSNLLLKGAERAAAEAFAKSVASKLARL